MKTLKTIINEAREIEYTVCLLSVLDSDNLPINITIKVDKLYAKQFEKWLEDEQDDIFSHAYGGNVEY